MNIDRFKSIIDGCPEAKEVQPQFFGEATLHPDLPEAITYCKDRGKKVSLYTNGNWTGDWITRELARSNLDKLIFSVEADTPALYELIRPGLDFHRLCTNIDNFNISKNHTTTIVRMTVCEENEENIDEIEKFWYQRVDGVVRVPECNTLRNGRVGLGSAHGYDCTRPWEQMVVKWDGTVVLCCCDWFGDYPVGHIDDGIPECWNGREMDEFRGQLLRKEWPEICQTCGFRYT